MRVIFISFEYAQLTMYQTCWGDDEVVGGGPWLVEVGLQCCGRRWDELVGGIP